MYFVAFFKRGSAQPGCILDASMRHAIICDMTPWPRLGRHRRAGIFYHLSSWHVLRQFSKLFITCVPNSCESSDFFTEKWGNHYFEALLLELVKNWSALISIIAHNLALRLLKIIEPYLVEQERMANAQLLRYGSRHLVQNNFFFYCVCLDRSFPGDPSLPRTGYFKTVATIQLVWWWWWWWWYIKSLSKRTPLLNIHAWACMSANTSANTPGVFPFQPFLPATAK
jgi:hypothetical protein